MATGTVLIVEDERGIIELFQATFSGLFELRIAEDYQEFLELLPTLQAPLVALLDENFPGGTGKQVAEVLRDKLPEAKLISTSANHDRDITWEPDARLRKPVRLAELLSTTNTLMQGQN